MISDPKGVKKSNYGGWQSNSADSFLARSESSIRQLELLIMQETDAFLAAVSGRKVARVSILESWANGV